MDSETGPNEGLTRTLSSANSSQRGHSSDADERYDPLTAASRPADFGRHRQPAGDRCGRGAERDRRCASPDLRRSYDSHERPQRSRSPHRRTKLGSSPIGRSDGQPSCGWRQGSAPGSARRFHAASHEAGATVAPSGRGEAFSAVDAPTTAATCHSAIVANSTQSSTSGITRQSIFGDAAGVSVFVTGEHETDPRRLEQRQKQIDLGKNTLGYDRYTQLVPRNRRRRDDPRTPDIRWKMSKRKFDQKISDWRRSLHRYDEDARRELSATATKTTRSTPKAKVEVESHECLAAGHQAGLVTGLSFESLLGGVLGDASIEDDPMDFDADEPSFNPRDFADENARASANEGSPLPPEQPSCKAATAQLSAATPGQCNDSSQPADQLSRRRGLRSRDDEVDAEEGGRLPGGSCATDAPFDASIYFDCDVDDQLIG